MGDDLGRGRRSNTGVPPCRVERLTRAERRAACLLGGWWADATRRRLRQIEEALELAHVANRGLCAVNAFDGGVRGHAALLLARPGQSISAPSEDEPCGAKATPISIERQAPCWHPTPVRQSARNRFRVFDHSAHVNDVRVFPHAALRRDLPAGFFMRHTTKDPAHSRRGFPDPSSASQV
jgi:hypothetical protein